MRLAGQIVFVIAVLAVGGLLFAQLGDANRSTASVNVDQKVDQAGEGPRSHVCQSQEGRQSHRPAVLGDARARSGRDDVRPAESMPSWPSCSAISKRASPKNTSGRSRRFSARPSG